MNVYKEIPKLNNTAITIGTFDGVHRGHRALINHLVETAQDGDIESVVVTFDPHPREVLGSDGKFMQLTSLEEKIERISELRVDNLVILPFTEELARLSAEQFVEDILVNRLGMKHLIVGYDNHFGRNREGSALLMRELGEKFGFEVRQIEKIGEVSSTKLREAIRAGEYDKIAEML